MNLTHAQLRMMRHAVGARWHRNYYVTAKGTEQDLEWSALVRDGYATLFNDSVTTRTLHLTQKGLEAVMVDRGPGARTARRRKP